jgi:general secretion pathway protein K
MRRARQGFALPLVLWLIVMIAAAAAVVTVTAREAVGSATNRVSLTRAQWSADGCAQEALASLEGWLAESMDPAKRWAALDSTSLAASAACDIRLVPAGLGADVNTVPEQRLEAMMRNMGLNDSDAMTLAAAIADWRDRDDNPRPSGAERDWYDQNARVSPRNAAFAAPEEVALVRGAELLSGIDTLLAVDGDPIVLSRAPAAVISSLPGVSPEALAIILAARAESPFPELAMIGERLVEPARSEFMTVLPELLRLTTPYPSIWILTVSARSPPANVAAFLELRLARDNMRVAVVRRRTWP